ncbi:MAG: H-X9-DG-CTERM domain-containing protein [Pirellulales bacterium]
MPNGQEVRSGKKPCLTTGTTVTVCADCRNRPLSIDATPDENCRDADDRVRGFYSFHSRGANFVFADGSVQFVTADVAARVYIALSTIDSGEPISADAF